MFILMFILFGLLVAAIALVVAPPRTARGWAIPPLVGIGGSLFGGWMGQRAGMIEQGEPSGWGASVLGAVVALGLLHIAMRMRRLGTRAEEQ